MHAHAHIHTQGGKYEITDYVIFVLYEVIGSPVTHQHTHTHSHTLAHAHTLSLSFSILYHLCFE